MSKAGILDRAETKIMVNMVKLRGYVSYSYIVSNCWFPLAGGLFVGEDATDAHTQTTGPFPDSHDQRNTCDHGSSIR